jgi:hypothetical protein
MMFSSGTLPSRATARPAAHAGRRALRVFAAKGSKNAKGGGGGSGPRLKSPGDVKEGSAYSQVRARGRRLVARRRVASRGALHELARCARLN